jgi:hypothetical protein
MQYLRKKVFFTKQAEKDFLSSIYKLVFHEQHEQIYGCSYFLHVLKTNSLKM